MPGNILLNNFFNPDDKCPKSVKGDNKRIENSALFTQMYRKISSKIPAAKTPMDKASAGAFVSGERPIKNEIITMFKIQGVKAAAAKRPTEFKTPANKETNDTKIKKGNVIRDKQHVSAIFPAILSNPGAIIKAA